MIDPSQNPITTTRNEAILRVAKSPASAHLAGLSDSDADRLRHLLSCLIDMRRACVLGLRFVDPAWDVLLALYESELQERRLSRSDVCLATGMPATTARRAIEALVATGGVGLQPDRYDRRRAYIRLTEQARDALIHILHTLDHRISAAGARDRQEDSHELFSTFCVEGSGAFPLRMLTIERCWPLREHDVSAIVSNGDPDEGERYRQVWLACATPRSLDFRAWASSGWRIIL